MLKHEASLRNNRTVWRNETAVVIDMWNYFSTNPQHCWSDVVFPLLYGHSVPIDHYILHAPEKDTYCENTVRRLGILQGNSVDVSNWACFIRSVRPLFIEYRAPSKSNRRFFLPTLFWERARLMAASRAECGPFESTNSIMLPDREFIMVYDRSDALRRRWNNAGVIVMALRTLFGEYWPVFHIKSIKAYSTCQQAMLHRRARMIIWPHGGQTANIVYSLPGVRVVEIMCGTPTSTGSINSIFYAKNLGIQWLTLHEPSCTHKGASEHPREFNLTIGDDVIKWLST